MLKAQGQCVSAHAPVPRAAATDADVLTVDLRNGHKHLDESPDTDRLRLGELAELRHRAWHDSLTQVVNRQRFLELVGDALRLSDGADRQVGLVYADLDDFKHINDRGGHAVGDQVLQGVAARWRGRLRAGDVLGRVGGDEFAVLCSGPGAEIISVASRVARALEDPVALADGSVKVTATVGVAIAAGGQEGPEELLARADAAMYQGKQRRSASATPPHRRPPTRQPASRRSSELPTPPAAVVDVVLARIDAATRAISTCRGLAGGATAVRLDAATHELDLAVKLLRAVKPSPP
jgi:diguanylate cyclase (GGDEF)-like protein